MGNTIRVYKEQGKLVANVQQHQQHHVTGWTGWIGFAGVAMIATAIVHVIYGIGGIFGQDWYIYAGGDAYLFDSSTWGWSLIVAGTLLFLSAMLLLAGNMLGRIVGVLLALGSLGINVAMIELTPVWSAIAIVLNLFIIYAILAHGSEMKHLDEEY